MPSGTIAKQDSVCAPRDLCADLLQVLIHRLSIDTGHDDCCTNCPCVADRAEKVDGVMAVVAHHRGTRADRCPDILQRPLLPHSSFILKPHLDRFASGRSRQRLSYQAGEVFLKVSWAAASFFG